VNEPLIIDLTRVCNQTNSATKTGRLVQNLATLAKQALLRDCDFDEEAADDVLVALENVIFGEELD